MQDSNTQRRPKATPTAPTRRQGLKTALGLTLGLAFVAGMAGPAMAQEWPQQPVKLVVPFAAGGATDLLARALAVELSKSWKQTVVVDNKPGAGGALGTENVARAAADGYTLLLASGSQFTVNPFIYKKLGYTAQNFEMITKVASGPMVVTVNADVPAKTVKELIAVAKAKPGRLMMASAGIGSQVHMAGEAFSDAAGMEVTHIPYKGEGPAYGDLMGGQVQLAVGNINAISPLLKGGRLRALATTGKERSALLPDVPTVAEAGLPGFEFVGWFGMLAPAGTAPAITQRIYADIQHALKQPGMKRYLAEQGMSEAFSAPGEMAADITRESVRWRDLVARRQIVAN